MFFNFFVNIAEFAGFRELANPGMKTVERFTLFLLRLAKVLHFICGVDLWGEMLVKFRDRRVIIAIISSVL